MTFLTVLLVLAPASPALAQSSLGDVLGDILSGRQGGGYRSWHGHLVQAKGTTMIFRAWDDGQTYAVDMSAINAQTWHRIALGQPMTLAAKPGPLCQRA